MQRLAPEYVARETLDQRAIRGAGRRRLRFGASARRVDPEWQDRTLISEFSFINLDGSLRELRQVLTVDGKAVPQDPTALKKLAAQLTAHGDEAQRLRLEEFHRLGLEGAASDFGQILLLFSADSVQGYEFHPAEQKMMGADRVRVFRYQQVDGRAALTVYDGKSESRQTIDGEIWAREPDYLPLRITMNASTGEGPHSVREEAAVDYLQQNGVLLPVSIVHREWKSGEVTGENRFRYTPFRKRP